MCMKGRESVKSKPSRLLLHMSMTGMISIYYQNKLNTIRSKTNAIIVTDINTPGSCFDLWFDYLKVLTRDAPQMMILGTLFNRSLQFTRHNVPFIWCLPQKGLKLPFIWYLPKNGSINHDMVHDPKL